VLADDDELAAYALLKLMERTVPPADLLVGDELQRDWVRQAASQFAENLGQGQRRQLHVLSTPRVQPVALLARLELVRRCRHDVEVSVEDDPEVRSLRTVINHAIVASRESLGFAASRRFAPEFGLT
jgi:hypothetical protein